MKHIISQIDDAIQMTVRTNYRGSNDYYEYVVSKPLEASGFLKWRIRIVKAFSVLFGNADAFKYSKYQ